MKIGDKYKIHCYKHNGEAYQASEETIILDIKDEYIVCGNYMVDVTEPEGHSYKTKELAIIYFYKHNCNMASPYIIDDNVIKYIDYDLDLRVFPDGGYKILDHNEYKYHKKKMKYPEEIDIIINKELQKLIKMRKNNEGPFDRKEIKKYKDLYKELNKIM